MATKEPLPTVSATDLANALIDALKKANQAHDFSSVVAKGSATQAAIDEFSEIAEDLLALSFSR